MKHRLPTVNQGETCWPRSGSRRSPTMRTATHPPGATRQARGRGDRGQREPARLPGRADRLPAQLHRQRRERHPELPGAGRTGGPSRGRSYTAPPPFRGRRTPHPPPATSASTEPIISATSSRKASVNASSSAWLTPHRSRTRRSSGSGPPPGHNAGTPTRTPAARHTTGRRGEGTPHHGRLPRIIDRKRARPYDGHRRHRLGSLLAVGANEARRDP